MGGRCEWMIADRQPGGDVGVGCSSGGRGGGLECVSWSYGLTGSEWLRNGMGKSKYGGVSWGWMLTGWSWNWSTDADTTYALAKRDAACASCLPCQRHRTYPK